MLLENSAYSAIEFLESYTFDAISQSLLLVCEEDKSVRKYRTNVHTKDGFYEKILQ